MNDLFKTVTVEEFKSYYFRDFPYLPTYEENKTYFTGDIVYFENEFYKSLSDNNTTEPTNSANWEVVKDNIYNYVTDSDIQKALGQALLTADESFGGTDEEKITIFLHLVAFYLVMDIRNASTGVNSSYAGLVASKSVGDVSESYNFPNWVTNSPIYSIYSQNGYGMKYLSLIIPYLSCTILFSRGRTTYG